MFRLLLFIPLIALNSCTNRPLYTSVSIDVLEKMMANSGDSLYIFNFWATWCGPCREEMPAFDRVTKELDSAKIKVYLVSVDEPRFVESHLVPYLKKHRLDSQVLWLNASNPAYWIDRVNKNWGGNIPITILIYSPQGLVELHDREISYEELVKYINDITHD